VSTASFHLGRRLVGAGAPALCVAELSANHQGSFDRARELVAAAAAAGADAVKVQTYTPDTITLRSDRPEFLAAGAWAGRTLHDLYDEAAMPWEWQPELAAAARDLGLEFFSSVFDPTAVAFCESIGVAAYKIASFELVDIPLVEAAAATGKPLVVSTGMATRREIDEVVAAARRAGPCPLALLVCTSAYPAPPHAANLRRIVHLAETFDVVTGVSDHTTGPEVPIVAAALGARIVEKHFTLRRADGGVDAGFSLEPDEFAAMVRSVRTAEAALGAARYGPTEAEATSLQYRRSLYVVSDVAAGDEFTPGNVRSVRPAAGLHPRHLPEVLGRRARRAAGAGTPLSWDLVG
jgi:N-acetylneuraminate synthase